MEKKQPKKWTKLQENDLPKMKTHNTRRAHTALGEKKYSDAIEKSVSKRWTKNAPKKNP